MKHCNFCGVIEDHLRYLIAGPKIYICDNCVYLCNKFIEEAEKRKQNEQSVNQSPPEL